MKLASLKSGRDGRLIVVSDDLSSYLEVDDITPTLQMALENWENVEPKLRDRYASLCSDPKATAKKFDATLCAAPLPRAYHWVDGSVYLNHMKLVRQSRGAKMPDSSFEEPLPC